MFLAAIVVVRGIGGFFRRGHRIGSGTDDLPSYRARDGIELSLLEALSVGITAALGSSQIKKCIPRSYRTS